MLQRSGLVTAVEPGPPLVQVLNASEEDLNGLLIDPEPAELPLVTGALAEASIPARVEMASSLEDIGVALRSPSPARRSFDFVLIDLDMPPLGAAPIIALVRSSSSHKAVVIVTSSLFRPGDRARLLSQGADGFFSKPMSLEGYASLVSVLQELLPARRASGAGS